MNIPWAKPSFWGKERKFVADALRSSWISDGPYVEKFEKDFASLHGVKFCLTTSSGTSAIYLALLAAGIGSGDEVIVPGLSFMAPAHMVLAIGARPVYADIDPRTWSMDPACVRQLVSKKTKAIVAVHLYGNVCDMAALRGLARRHGLRLIEDVAEAAFSKYRGKYAGTFGEIGCYSFQATKTIAMGEGGCVLVSSRRLYDRLRLIRNHGMSNSRKYWHDVVGHNFRLTNMQAALGYAQLKNIKKILAAKQRVYELYSRNLQKERGLTMQFFKREVSPIVWCVAVYVDPSVFGTDRDGVMQSLAEAGVETRPGFYPASVMPFYQAAPLPISERVGLGVITLPSFPSLTEGQIKDICGKLKKIRDGRWKRSR